MITVMKDGKQVRTNEVPEVGTTMIAHAKDGSALEVIVTSEMRIKIAQYNEMHRKNEISIRRYELESARIYTNLILEQRKEEKRDRLKFAIGEFVLVFVSIIATVYLMQS